jgi:cell pole-organizing protein PopZ
MGDMSREPSMEDILSSIRRVIAREDAVGDTPVPRAAVLQPAAAEIAAEADENIDEDGDVLELGDDAADDAEMDVAPVAALDPLPTAELVSPQSADAARQSLDALTAVIAPAVAGAAEQSLATGGGTTVDALVREALRPMLKQWLDANLPEMVESMVAREIARITGKRF